ncbi:MAG: MarR family winged helix-turn-helix transcriptional regulator [Butyrivibrio sp.]
MDYEKLADEIINMRGSRQHVSFDRKLSDVAKGEMFVLNYLKNHGNKAHPKELSDEMIVSTARTAVILNHLEDDGLIERVHDDTDNRQIFVCLSLKGIEVIQEHYNNVIRYMVKIFEKIGEKDAREYVRIQKEIMKAISES